MNEREGLTLGALRIKGATMIEQLSDAATPQLLYFVIYRSIRDSGEVDLVRSWTSDEGLGFAGISVEFGRVRCGIAQHRIRWRIES